MPVNDHSMENGGTLPMQLTNLSVGANIQDVIQTI